MNLFDRYHAFRGKIEVTWHLLNKCLEKSDDLLGEIKADVEEGPLRLLNPDGGLDRIALDSFGAVRSVWREDGRPAVRIYNAHGASFDIVDADTTPYPEPDQDPLRQFCDWYRASEEDYQRWLAWIKQPPRPAFNTFLTTATLYPDGAVAYYSLYKEDIRTIECIEAIDTFTGEKIRCIRLALNHQARTEIAFTKGDEENIRILAAWRGVEPEKWLAWVGAPTTTEILTEAVLQTGEEVEDALHDPVPHPELEKKVFSQEPCRTEDCENEAEYFVSYGKLAVCHECYGRLKEVLADMDRYADEG